MLSQLEKYGAPDALVFVSLNDLDAVKEKIRWLNGKYGFTRFCFAGLTKGHRSTGYPTREDYRENAEKFAAAREWVKEQGLSVGWFCCLTVKSGRDDFAPIIRLDGTEHPFANCPTDERFADRISSDIAYYASVARPDFIFLEDDFSISAAQGCFCSRHLDALAERCGHRYEREELLAALEKDDTASLEVRRAWCAVKGDSLISLATRIRARMDEECPEIPIGIMQSGGAYHDGDVTEQIARALAGENHTPFIRLYGTYYCGFDTKTVPVALFNSLYKTEHMSPDVLRYHESDSYPHMRYYTSGLELTSLMAAAYSYGMVGSIFIAQQTLDEPWEEDAYVKHFSRERKRLEALCSLTKGAENLGVELTFDPFYNTLGNSGYAPDFTECIGRFGIPFTTRRASVALWDERCARYSDDKTVMDYLSRGLILDGDSARVLCERGYGRYLGVTVGESLIKKNPSLVFDLGAKERICDGYVPEGLGRKMHPAHAYCPARGREWLEMTVTDERCEVVSEALDFRGNLLSPAMTYFENSLGGKVAVISQGMRANHSQSIYNYRRAALIQDLIAKMSDEYPFVKCAPDVYLTASRRDGNTLLTLINLCSDDAECLRIYLPKSLRAGEILTIGTDGALVPLQVECTDDGIRLAEPLRHLVPCYLLIRG